MRLPSSSVPKQGPAPQRSRQPALRCGCHASAKPVDWPIDPCSEFDVAISRRAWPSGHHRRDTLNSRPGTRARARRLPSCTSITWILVVACPQQAGRDADLQPCGGAGDRQGRVRGELEAVEDVGGVGGGAVANAVNGGRDRRTGRQRVSGLSPPGLLDVLKSRDSVISRGASTGSDVRSC